LKVPGRRRITPINEPRNEILARMKYLLYGSLRASGVAKVILLGESRAKD